MGIIYLAVFFGVFLHPHPGHVDLGQCDVQQETVPDWLILSHLYNCFGRCFLHLDFMRRTLY